MEWLAANWPMVASVMWGLCEVLALTPLKSNSVFTLIYNALKGVKEKLLPPK